MFISRRFRGVRRHAAHAALSMFLSAALGLAVAPGLAAGKLGSAAHSGWQSPAQGGNGDYAFIDSPAPNATVQGTVHVSGRAGNSATDPNGGGTNPGTGAPDFTQKSQVVIAMIDTGGNPYHADFRDDTRLVSPSTYLNGFPSNAKAVPLCFIDTNNGSYSYNDDCSASWSANVAADRGVTNGVAVGDLVWYPGTRLMSKSFAHEDTQTPVGIDQGGGDSATSHGSWVSSTAIGNTYGTCPDCLLIVLEADSVDAIDQAYLWAAQQPWIDVITSSTTVGLAVGGFNPGVFAGKHDGAVEASKNGKIFVTSSGNGLNNFGLVPTTTFLYDSASPAVISVGASYDDGTASHWSDFPAEIMANGNDREVGDASSMSGEIAVGGTSFSAPAAAGTLARSLLEARRACRDYREGVTTVNGALTLLRNNGCSVTSGPFADGSLTRDELHEAFVKNAIPPYDQLAPIPGPVTWAKNAYGYVDLGNGIHNGGSTIQPLVTASILGTRPIPVRALEQFWYDGVVRRIQAQQWGARPVVDGDSDAYPRNDGACMPVCAPDELQKYASGFAGLGGSSTYQDLFRVLGVSAQQFARAAPAGFGGVYRRPGRNVAGAIGEVGDITLGNDAQFLTVRLNMAGVLDGTVPTVRSNPVSYEVTFTANHNGIVQSYRLAYEFQAIDVLGLTSGRVSTPLSDAFSLYVDAAAGATGTSSICPITADLSQSHFDTATQDAVWVIPLNAFSQNNKPADCTFTNAGRALRAGDVLSSINGSAVLTVGVVNFGDGLGLFSGSTHGDYTLSQTVAADADGDGVADAADRCSGTPAGARVDARGCHVALTINGQPAGAATTFTGGGWGADISLAGRAPVDGGYVIVASYGTASDSVSVRSSGEDAPMTATLSSDKNGGDVSNGTVTVTFTASASSPSHPADTLEYTFDFGDGNQTKQGGRVASHGYSMAGRYQTSVIVTDQHGNSAVSSPVIITTTTGVTVDPNTDTKAALATRFQDGNSKVPAHVFFDGAGSSARSGRTLASYSFDFGDGSTHTGSGTPGEVEHVYTIAGSYSAGLTVTDSEGDTSSAMATVVITSAQALTAQLSVSPSRVITGQDVTFDGCSSLASGDGTPITRYAFDLGDGTATQPHIVTRNVADSEDACRYVYQYTTPGSYTPSLTVYDSNNASAQSKALVRVNPAAQASTAETRISKGGAFGFALLLPLLAAALRRRRTH